MLSKELGMEHKIDSPQIFISYAWSSKEYEQKVLDFASRLKSDGIQVILDKWLMKPGSDTIDFMEQCVKNPSVNFVLMLLDKTYTEKADGRRGGVGIETQIISAQVYKDVSQEKFIPIIFDRDDNGRIYVPVYLNTRYYFDMTKDNRDEEYVKLVKTLYGRQMYHEPELGTKPIWVDEDNESDSKLKFEIAMNKNEAQTLNQLYSQIEAFDCVDQLTGTDQERADKILQNYNNFIPLRNLFIEIMLKSYVNENFIDNICDFYDKVKKIDGRDLKKEILSEFIHETFIYLIGILYKNRKYKEINIIITKTYFVTNGITAAVNSNYYFSCGSYDKVNAAKRIKDNKNYYSGLAALWMENIYVKAINKEEFVFADVLVYNLSIILLGKQDWYWFPKSYCYQSEYNSLIADFSHRLKSKYELMKKKDLFSGWGIETLKEHFGEMKTLKDDGNRRYRYPQSFDWVNLILDFISVKEIGSLN